MAKYPAVITTQAGINAVAEANATRQALIFTKILIGAGNAPVSADNATALTDKRLELEITKRVKSGDGQFTVQGLLTNKTLTNGFYAKEIGLMAKVGDSGREILFSYTNGGNYVDYIPDKNTPIDSYTFTVTTVVGNAERVEAIVHDNGVASVRDLNTHNSDNNAHAELLKLFLRLTGGTLTGDLNIINSYFGFKPDNSGYSTKIRLASNGNFDIGVTEDANNKNATSQLMLHSQNRPKWYNSGIGGKELATLEDLSPIKNLLGQGGIVASKLDANAGFVKFANGFTIQWGAVNSASQSSYISYPIAFRTVFSISGVDLNVDGDPLVLSMFLTDNTKFMLTGRRTIGGRTNLWCHWIAVGIA